MEGNRQRQAAIERSKAGREGRRYGAFYEGHCAYLAGVRFEDCPHRGALAHAWRNGWRYAEAES